MNSETKNFRFLLKTKIYAMIFILFRFSSWPNTNHRREDDPTTYAFGQLMNDGTKWTGMIGSIVCMREE